MDERGWRVARLHEIPANAELDGETARERFAAVQERAPAAVARWASDWQASGGIRADT